ncbi:glutamine-hydrolyzing carbamoyl-phosphate synthase small subunit [Candidatus Beckwithbacteria bacterium]|nr:glutamine-hydrolyzing carbamoyl-phosphate synthase small subunit [Candidatus Beckwithbacteria bacterium]
MKTYLHLEDGSSYQGQSFGLSSETAGEVVFSTGMTGYEQSLTDPSFADQILIFTYPLIGNYGIAKKQMVAKHLVQNFESEKVQVRGLVVSELCHVPSHYQASLTLDTWLKKEKIPGISGIDTRSLTQKIREGGVLRGAISPQKQYRFKKFPSMHAVSQVSCRQSIIYPAKNKSAKKIVLIDCGVKHGIVRELLSLGYHLIRIPWDADPLALGKIDGVICGNGPGDPKDCPQTVANIQKVLKAQIPFLGICLGHQLLSLAIGADTYKLPYGHRGLNQPCMDLTTKKAYVTSQNHGYAVDRKTIPAAYGEWFINLNDQTNEGIFHKKLNIRSVQFHPEGCPGPFDTKHIFKFV